MTITKLNENSLIFGMPKRLYTMSLPSEINETFIMEEFGRTSNVNLQFNGKPIRIHEGKITYYESDGGFARALLKNLVEEAKKKAKTKIIFNPEMDEIKTEEKIND